MLDCQYEDVRDQSLAVELVKWAAQQYSNFILNILNNNYAIITQYKSISISSSVLTSSSYVDCAASFKVLSLARKFMNLGDKRNHLPLLSDSFLKKEEN